MKTRTESINVNVIRAGLEGRGKRLAESMEKMPKYFRKVHSSICTFYIDGELWIRLMSTNE